MGYLPERRRDLSGPRDAAAAWWRVIEQASWRQKPLAAALAVLAVTLASLKGIRRISRF